MNNSFKKRIDDLGRIVIPKPIRNSFKINDFDELEIFIDDDNIIIKKSDGIKFYKDIINHFLAFLKETVNINVLILEKKLVVCTNINEIKYNDLVKNSLNYNNYIYIDNYEIINDIFIKGNIVMFPLIYNSIKIGDIIFFSEKKQELELFKSIITLIINYVK